MADASSIFGQLTDAEWLTLLQRSVDEEYIEGLKFPRFPPDSLQSQFVGSSNSHALQEAFYFYSELKKHALAAGTPLVESSKILDFGCGWGRYLRFFWKDVKEDGLYGVDVDPDILQVCRDTGVPGSLSRIVPKGTLPYAEGFFTHAMAYSVFTHLPQDVHLHWLGELARVVRPGGTFTLTLESGRFLDFVAQQSGHAPVSPWHQAMVNFSQSVPAYKRAFEAGQYVYMPTGGGNYRDAETYGDAVVPLSFVKEHWAEHFEVLDYIDDAARFWQAVLVVRRR